MGCGPGLVGDTVWTTGGRATDPLGSPSCPRPSQTLPRQSHSRRDSSPTPDTELSLVYSRCLITEHRRLTAYTSTPLPLVSGDCCSVAQSTTAIPGKWAGLWELQQPGLRKSLGSLPSAGLCPTRAQSDNVPGLSWCYALLAWSITPPSTDAFLQSSLIRVLAWLHGWP